MSCWEALAIVGYFLVGFVVAVVYYAKSSYKDAELAVFANALWPLFLFCMLLKFLFEGWRKLIVWTVYKITGIDWGRKHSLSEYRNLLKDPPTESRGPR
jgi:hypothetical protein